MAKRPDAPSPLLEYGVPTALIAAAALVALWLPDPIQVLIPAVALACGVALRPRRVWIVWIAVTVTFAAGVLIWLLLGKDLPKATEPITPSSFLAGAWIYLLFFAGTAMLPLWLGRWLRSRLALQQRTRPPSAA